MRKILMTVAMLGIAAPALAQEVSPERRDLFVSAIAEHGCAMTEEVADTVLPGLGFVKDETRAIVNELISEGLASVANDTLTLADELCGGTTTAAGGGDTPHDRFVALMRDNGCAMAEADAPGLLAGIGMSMDESEPIVGAMIGAGEATFDNGVLTLSDEVCTTVTSDGIAVPDTSPENMAAIIREQGCRISGADAMALLPDYGFTEDQAVAIANDWTAQGLASFEGDDLVLGDALCSGGAVAVATPEDILLTALRDAGCRMSQAEAGATLPGMGLGMDEAEQIARGWVGQGLASFEGNDLVLGDELCGGGGDTTGLDTSPERMAEIIRDNGCAMTSDEAETMLPSLGFPEEVALPIAQEWINQGLARFEGDSVILSPEFCEGGTEVVQTPEDIFLGAMRDAGCRMSQSDAGSILPGLGVDMDTVVDIAEGWVAAGEAAFEGQDLVLGGALCAGGDGADAGGDSSEARFVAVIEQHGCSMSGTDAATIIPAAGVPVEEVPAIVDSLIAQGLATLENDILTLATENCR